MLCACEMIELLLENGDLVFVDAGFLHLRQSLLGEVLEGGAIELGACSQGRCRHVQGNARFALDLRQGLELLKGRNVDMKHGLVAHRYPETSRSAVFERLAEAPYIGIDGHQSRGPLQCPRESTAGGKSDQSVAPFQE